MKSDDSDSVSSTDIAEVLADPLTPDSIVDGKSSGSSSPSSPEDPMHTESVTPMFDRTRLGMCVLMMSFFVFDPFNFIFSWQRGI